MLDVLYTFRLVDLVDIGIVAFIVYRIILLIKGTRAVQMLIGLTLILVLYLCSQVFELNSVHWLLDNFLASIILVIVVIFQNDIRRALMHMGSNPFFGGLSMRESDEMIDEVVQACLSMANRKIGALIVLERETGLKDLLEVGTTIDAHVSSELMTAIFLPHSPLHDGALVIQHGRLRQAGCFLPLSQDPAISKTLGTRHRAAIGLTELVDAVTIVISEETGKISVVVGGRITRDLDGTTLTRVLKRLLESRQLKASKRK